MFMKLFTKEKSYVYILIFVLYLPVLSVPPINLFRPSDRFLMPNVYQGTCYQFTFAYEGSINSRGFQDDFRECQIFRQCPEPDTKVNVLQIYQDKQNLLAAFKGFDSLTTIGQISQIFNINDENSDQKFFVPKGNLKVPLNGMFSARYYFNHNISLGLHLPVISMELKDVRWFSCGNDSTQEDLLENKLISILKEVSDLDITGWKRTGVGDLVAQVTWMENFPQYKPLLKNVVTQARFGLNFPTGKKEDVDKILAFPFGNDGSWGIQFGGGIDLEFCYWVRGGLDIEFLYLFGNTRCRRVKVDCNQTDLLFLTKVPAFRDFGFGQQYNIYIESGWKNFSFKINYQHLRRNDDKLYICNDKIDPFVVNSAENLQDWTAHSFIFSLGYDGCDYNGYFIPAIYGWYKLGFNGKRAVLLDTLGLTFTLSF